MKKLSNIVESFWGDVHKRSRGDEVRKEDDVDLITDRKVFRDYLKKHYKETDTSGVCEIEAGHYCDRVTVPVCWKPGVDSETKYLSIEDFATDDRYMTLTYNISKFPDIYKLLSDNYRLHILRDLSGKPDVLDIEPKDKSKVTNKLFLEVLDLLLDNIVEPLESLVEKKTGVNESFWGDVHRRSRGDEVRKEDEVPQELQKPLASYIDMFASHAACRGDYTLGSYPDFRAFVKDFMDSPRILQLRFDMQFLLDYIKDHWNDILPIILDTYNKIEDDINVAVDDIVNHLKKQDLKESFWGDVHKRSRGDEIRKEDEIGNLRSLKPVDMGGSVLWADQNLIYDGDEIFTFEDANNLISDSGWRLPTRKEVAELDGHNIYYDTQYIYLDDDKKLSFKKCGCGYTPKTGRPFTIDENNAFYGWTSEPYQHNSNDIHVFVIDHFELAYSPEKETINNQVTQNADSKCCVRLVKDK